MRGAWGDMARDVDDGNRSGCIQSLSAVLKQTITPLAAKNGSSRIAKRAAEVQSMWRCAVEHVYGESASLVLAHVNAVYIKREDDGKQLIVYLDDPGIRADVHARQHFLLLYLRQRFNEDIAVFRTLAAKMGMRERHPYLDDAGQVVTKQSEPLTAGQAHRRYGMADLTSEEREQVEKAAAAVGDPLVRRSLEDAMASFLAAKR